MAVYDKLKEINDENRREILNNLTPTDLRSAGMDGWAGIFDELRKLKSDTIQDERLNRELMRKIYPYYDLSHTKKQEGEIFVQDLFEQLSKSPVFKTAACKWEQTPPKERALLLVPVVVETAEKMKLSSTYLATYEENSTTLGYVTRETGSKVFHLNKHPKVFENMSFSNAMDTLCHELTHLRQQDKEDKISPSLQEGESLENIIRQSSSLAPHFMAPYFSYSPENLEQLQAAGYQWDSKQDYIAYTSHPKEKEAFFCGTQMGKLVQSAMDNGYGQGLMENPYDPVFEKDIGPGSVKLGGFTEDHNPEKHLAAGTALLQKALKKQVFGQSLTDAVGDGFAHYLACLKYGEYLTPSPAVEMLSLVAYYARQKAIMDVLEQSGHKATLSNILEISQKSQNSEISEKAQKASYLIDNVPIKQYQNKPKEKPQQTDNLLEELKRNSQNQDGEPPMDKHNAIDYRDVSGRDLKPVEPPKIPTDSLEEIRRRKREELYQQMNVNNSLLHKKENGI